MASLPRLRWQNRLVNRALEATCSQWPRPATRSPVSSTCTRSAPARAWRAAAVNGASPAAARLVQAATVPAAIGVPNSSASNPALRSTGRGWPRHREIAIAPAGGPYCTRAPTPARAGAPGVAPPAPPRPPPPGRAGAGGDPAAGAAGAPQPVPDPPHGDLGDVEHLPADDPHRRDRGGQLRPAAGTCPRLVHHALIGPLDLPQRAALPA